MKRNNWPAIPFSVAILLHAVGVVCAGRLLVWPILSGAMVPGFQQGESSLELTLLTSDSRPENPKPVIPPLQPAVSIQDPIQVEDAETVPVTEDEQLDPVVEEEPAVDSSNAEAGVEGPERPGENINADLLDKGVAGGARPLSAIRPVYPLGPRLRGEEGVVVLGVKIDFRGEVQSVTVIESSGYSGLDNSAVKAVKRARFVAAQSDGQPRESELKLPVRFRLLN